MFSNSPNSHNGPIESPEKMGILSRFKNGMAKTRDKTLATIAKAKSYVDAFTNTTKALSKTSNFSNASRTATIAFLGAFAASAQSAQLDLDVDSMYDFNSQPSASASAVDEAMSLEGMITPALKVNSHPTITPTTISLNGAPNLSQDVEYSEIQAGLSISNGDISTNLTYIKAFSSDMAMMIKANFGDKPGVNGTLTNRLDNSDTYLSLTLGAHKLPFTDNGVKTDVDTRTYSLDLTNTNMSSFGDTFAGIPTDLIKAGSITVTFQESSDKDNLSSVESAPYLNGNLLQKDFTTYMYIGGQYAEVKGSISYEKGNLSGTAGAFANWTSINDNIGVGAEATFKYQANDNFSFGGKVKTDFNRTTTGLNATYEFDNGIELSVGVKNDTFDGTENSVGVAIPTSMLLGSDTYKLGDTVFKIPSKVGVGSAETPYDFAVINGKTEVKTEIPKEGSKDQTPKTVVTSEIAGAKVKGAKGEASVNYGDGSVSQKGQVTTASYQVTKGVQVQTDSEGNSGASISHTLSGEKPKKDPTIVEVLKRANKSAEADKLNARGEIKKKTRTEVIDELPDVGDHTLNEDGTVTTVLDLPSNVKAGGDIITDLPSSAETYLEATTRGLEVTDLKAFMAELGSGPYELAVENTSGTFDVYNLNVSGVFTSNTAGNADGLADNFSFEAVVSGVLELIAEHIVNERTIPFDGLNTADSASVIAKLLQGEISVEFINALITEEVEAPLIRMFLNGLISAEELIDISKQVTEEEAEDLEDYGQEVTDTNLEDRIDEAKDALNIDIFPIDVASNPTLGEDGRAALMTYGDATNSPNTVNINGTDYLTTNLAIDVTGGQIIGEFVNGVFTVFAVPTDPKAGMNIPRLVASGLQSDGDKFGDAEGDSVTVDATTIDGNNTIDNLSNTVSTSANEGASAGTVVAELPESDSDGDSFTHSNLKAYDSAGNEVTGLVVLDGNKIKLARALGYNEAGEFTFTWEYSDGYASKVADGVFKINENSNSTIQFNGGANWPITFPEGEVSVFNALDYFDRADPNNPLPNDMTVEILEGPATLEEGNRVVATPGYREAGSKVRIKVSSATANFEHIIEIEVTDTPSPIKFTAPTGGFPSVVEGINSSIDFTNYLSRPGGENLPRDLELVIPPTLSEFVSSTGLTVSFKAGYLDLDNLSSLGVKIKSESLDFEKEISLEAKQGYDKPDSKVQGNLDIRDDSGFARVYLADLFSAPEGGEAVNYEYVVDNGVTVTEYFDNDGNLSSLGFTYPTNSLSTTFDWSIEASNSGDENASSTVNGSLGMESANISFDTTGAGSRISEGIYLMGDLTSTTSHVIIDGTRYPIADLNVDTEGGSIQILNGQIVAIADSVNTELSVDVTVQLEESDGDKSTEKEIEFEIDPENDAPEVEYDTTFARKEGEEFEFGPKKLSDDGEISSLTAQIVNQNGTLSALPTWLNFNAETGIFSGTAPYSVNTEDGGSTVYNLVVTATDSDGRSSLEELSLTIGDQTSPLEEVNPTSDLPSLDEDKSTTLTIADFVERSESSDTGENLDDATVSWDSAFNEIVSQDQNGIITVSPTFGFGGEVITFTIKDKEGNVIGSKSLTINEVISIDLGTPTSSRTVDGTLTMSKADLYALYSPTTPGNLPVSMGDIEAANPGFNITEDNTNVTFVLPNRTINTYNLNIPFNAGTATENGVLQLTQEDLAPTSTCGTIDLGTLQEGEAPNFADVDLTACTNEPNGQTLAFAESSPFFNIENGILKATTDIINTSGAINTTITVSDGNSDNDISIAVTGIINSALTIADSTISANYGLTTTSLNIAQLAGVTGGTAYTSSTPNANLTTSITNAGILTLTPINGYEFKGEDVTVNITVNGEPITLTANMDNNTPDLNGISAGGNIPQFTTGTFSITFDSEITSITKDDITLFDYLGNAVDSTVTDVTITGSNTAEVTVQAGALIGPGIPMPNNVYVKAKAKRSGIYGSETALGSAAFTVAQSLAPSIEDVVLGASEETNLVSPKVINLNDAFGVTGVNWSIASHDGQANYSVSGNELTITENGTEFDDNAVISLTASNGGGSDTNSISVPVNNIDPNIISGIGNVQQLGDRPVSITFKSAVGAGNIGSCVATGALKDAITVPDVSTFSWSADNKTASFVIGVGAKAASPVPTANSFYLTCYNIKSKDNGRTITDSTSGAGTVTQ